jgi:hypothetical protein
MTFLWPLENLMPSLHLPLPLDHMDDLHFAENKDDLGRKITLFSVTT